MSWLVDHLIKSAQDVPEPLLGYCLGRGLPYALFKEMGVGLWTALEEPCPDPDFRTKYGDYGEKLHHWMSVPIWSPRGHVVGVEFRRWDGQKSHQKYFLPDAEWVPAYIGLVPSALHRIWKGGDVWLVEGLFDLALSHVTPPQDVVLACGFAKITRNQATFLQRFMTPQARVHVCFDMDDTGQKMAKGYVHPTTGTHVWGAVEVLNRMGLSARLVQFRFGKDPGEVWEAGGASRLRDAFGFRKP